MRELKGKDIFTFSKILKKMDLKLEKQEDMQAVMIDIMKKAVENINLAEVEVNSFLADLENKSVEEIENLSLKEYIDLLKEFKNKEEIASFFTSAEQTKQNS